MEIIATILKLLGILNLSIFLALFYDHRRNPILALKYIIGFIAFVFFGTGMALHFYMEAILMAPILIWVYFFVMVFNSKKSHKTKESETMNILDN